MSEQNIYKEHYDLQHAFAQSQATIQNIYQALAPTVAPHGVQLSLQEVIDLVVEKLGRFQTDVHASEPHPAAHDAFGAEPEKPAKAK